MGDHDQAFGGKKTIGMFAGVVLLINNITGPGVPGLPNMFSESGWLLPTIIFMVVWFMSSVSTTMYAEAMRRVPGNEHFVSRIEYTTVVQYYFGRCWYIASQIGLNGALQSLNIISVIQSSQVLDKALAAMGGHTCGFDVTPFSLYWTPPANGSAAGYADNYGDVVGGGGVDSFFGPMMDVGGKNHTGETFLPESTKFWTCVDINNVSGNNPWGCHMVLSGGFLLCMLITIPMGYYNLDDNMVVQVTAFALTIGCWVVWITMTFFAEPGEDVNIIHFNKTLANHTLGQGTWSIPMINTDPNFGSQAGVLGTILFNFGFVTTIPSWVNEKKPSVSVNKTVWYATTLCLVIFYVIGIPGAMAFKYYLQGPASNNCAYGVDTGDAGNCVQDLMQLILGNDANNIPLAPATWANHKALSGLMHFSVYLFPFVAILSSIPVFSIVVKYNCIENGMSRRFSFFWGIIFPWLAAAPLLYQPGALAQVITFSSLFFVSFTDFLVPWCLYIVMCQREEEDHNTHPALKEVIRGSYEAGERGLINDPASSIPLLGNGGGADAGAKAAPEHFAIPPDWKWTFKTKVYIASVMVVVMTGLSVAGTAMQIKQNSQLTWDCAGVSA